MKAAEALTAAEVEAIFRRVEELNRLCRELAKAGQTLETAAPAAPEPTIEEPEHS